MVMTPGAVRLLGFGNRPEAVADHEIESLRRIDDSEVIRRPWRYLPGGSMVEILSGPLTGVQGVLVTDGCARRIIVSVTLLHRSVCAELDENTVLKPLGAREVNDWKSQTSAPSHPLLSNGSKLPDVGPAGPSQDKRTRSRVLLISNAS
jgi:hypothetical protein